MERRGRGKKTLFTFGGGVAASLVVSMVVNYALLFSNSLTPFGRSVVSAGVLPVVIAVPLMFWIVMLLRQAASGREQIIYLSTHDRQTGLPLLGAFSSRLERRRANPKPGETASGAFLVVRAIVLQSIYENRGLSAGDDAVATIAAMIVSAVRSTDIVGRIGQDMFALYLGGATDVEARQIGQRISQRTLGLYGEAGSVRAAVEVQVGGILFDQRLGVEEMFSGANAQLNPTEKGGWVRIVPISEYATSSLTH